MTRETHKIDAADKIAGRLASHIAFLLQGKNKPSYKINVDNGDFVEVANVAKINFSGKKIEQKVYHRTTGYPGGIRTRQLKEMIVKNPHKILRDMVYDMLPKNKLRAGMIKRLKIS
ncbi:MAG: 50S ribosomal protein L13 [Patescibacteria group bacterium]|nr:50S ribosomal protein L13 [Patescibacteria group bacterium]